MAVWGLAFYTTAGVPLSVSDMVATADLAEIVGLAHRRQWHLVLVGDPAQLPAVGRCGVFAHLSDTLPHRLESPRRFHQSWEADASLALPAGDPTVSDTYAAHGRLSTAHPALAPDRVLDLLARHEQAGQHVAITTTTAETARRINPHDPSEPPVARACRSVGRREPCACRGPRRHPPQRPDDHHRPATDRRATARPGQPLRSPRPYVEHPERGLAKLPADYLLRHVELGWAVTGYGNQGDTVDVGIAVLAPTTSRAHVYVAMTRGRHMNSAIVVDPASGDPATGFAAIVARSPAERSALGTAHHLAQQAGVPDPATPADARPPSSVERTAKVAQQAASTLDGARGARAGEGSEWVCTFVRTAATRCRTRRSRAHRAGGRAMQPWPRTAATAAGSTPWSRGPGCTVRSRSSPPSCGRSEAAC